MKKDEVVKSKNQEKLSSFSEYCLKNPNERFWQALRNWSGNSFILTADSVDFEDDTLTYNNIRDTFYDR